MKRFLVTVFFLASLLGISTVTYAQVPCTNSSASEGSAATTTQVLSFPSNNTAGRASIVTIDISNTSSVPTIADSRGNTYMLVRTDTTALLGGMQVRTWVAFNIGAGSNTVTVSNINSGTYRRLAIAECAGLTAVDQSSGADGTSATPTAPAVNTGVATELIYGFAYSGSGGNPTAGSGFTGLGAPSFSLAENKVVMSTGSYSAIWTATGSSGWIAQMVTFSATTPPPPPLPATQINLATQVRGNLDITHLGGGTGASATTFWRGDGSWQVPAGGGGGSPGGSTGQTQYDSGGAFGGTTPYHVTAATAGADYCQKVTTGITASAVVSVDLTGTFTCSGGFSIVSGTNITFAPNTFVTVGGTIIQGQGTIVHGGGNSPSNGTEFIAANGLNGPVWKITNGASFTHWFQLDSIRIEGNSANQSGGLKTIETVGNSGIVTSGGGNTVTYKTTTSHGYSAGWEFCAINITTDVDYSAWRCGLIAATPTATTFTMTGFGGTNGQTGGGGIVMARPAYTDCLNIDAEAENANIHEVLVDDCGMSGYRWTGNPSGANSDYNLNAFGTFIGFNFDGIINTRVNIVMKGDGNQVHIRIKAGVGGHDNYIVKAQGESTGNPFTHDNDPFIWIDDSVSGGYNEIVGLFPPGGDGAMRTNIIRATGNYACGEGVTVIDRNSDATYTNFLYDGCTAITTASLGNNDGIFTWHMPSHMYGGLNLGGAGATGLTLPFGAGYAPTVDAQLAFNTTTHHPVIGFNGASRDIFGTPSSTVPGMILSGTCSVGHILTINTDGTQTCSPDVISDIQASDNFNRANGGLGTSWTASTNPITISSNTAIGSAGAISLANWNVITFNADQYAQATVAVAPTTDTADIIGPSIRHTAGMDTAYSYSCQGNIGRRILLDNAGSVSALAGPVGTPSTPCAVNDVLRIQVIGTKITAFLNGTVDMTATNSTLTSGQPGMLLEKGAQNSAVDNWQAGESMNVFQIKATSLQAGTLSTPSASFTGAQLLTVSSDFTTAANTNLQTITGLTKTMPASLAAIASFHCSLNWSQATGTAAVAFGIQGATTAPTNINANATSYTNTTAETTGTLNGLNTTTATAIVSAAPSAITTIWKAEMAGTLEVPSNASPTVINWMVSTATSGDAVTVKRGSYCSLIFQ